MTNSKWSQVLDAIVDDAADDGHFCVLSLRFDEPPDEVWRDGRIVTRKPHPQAGPEYPLQYHATGRDRHGNVRDFMFYACEVDGLLREHHCSAKAAS